MTKRKLTKAERDEWEAERTRMLANALWTRELAEKAEAKLDADHRRDEERLAERVRAYKEAMRTRKGREAERARMLANALWTRELAERAQAKLDAQRGCEN